MSTVCEVVYVYTCALGYRNLGSAMAAAPSGGLSPLVLKRAGA